MSDASWTAGDRVEKRRERREARAQCAAALETFYADKAEEQAEREAAIAEANDIFEEIEWERHAEALRAEDWKALHYEQHPIEDDDWLDHPLRPYVGEEIYTSAGYESMQDEFDSTGHLR